ncbi:GNAT family N-acetyltransferase [Chloroflexota bacterium]
MRPNLSSLIRLQKSQIKPAAEVLARAFQDYPLMAYFIPDASERKYKSLYLFQPMIRYGVLYGEVYAISPKLEGVAVWLPSEKTDMSFWRTVRSGGFLMIPRIGKGVNDRQRYFGEWDAVRHKRHAPFRHYFLLLIGVDPVFQGEGHGGTLLKAMLTRIDKEHLPCYVTTQNERNVPFYQHHGFKVVEKVIIPGTVVNHWAMLRGKPG